MVRTSILEKLEVIKDLIFDEPMLMIVFIAFIILGIALFAISFKDKRKYIKLYFLGYIFILLALIIEYNVDLYKILDYLINNIFYILIFPNVAVYGLVILISNILLLTGIFKEKTRKLFKIINVIFYSILGYLLFLILNIVIKDDIDVYSPASVYMNSNLSSLLQFSMILFLLWILILFICKISIKFKRKNKAKEQNTSKISEPVVEKTDTDTMSLNTSQQEDNSSVVLKEKQENNTTFTKEEYKLLLEILEKEKNERKYL